MYNVFDTAEEALTAEASDFAAYLAANPGMPQAYLDGTTNWDRPRQRPDGKWVYQVCPEGSQTHTKEVYSGAWFPSVDI